MFTALAFTVLVRELLVNNNPSNSNLLHTTLSPLWLYKPFSAIHGGAEGVDWSDLEFSDPEYVRLLLLALLLVRIGNESHLREDLVKSNLKQEILRKVRFSYFTMGKEC
jgi:hypothetical protein